jgi:hypothetical protein
MIFKSNNSLLALDKSALGNLHDFYYLDFLQSASLSYDVSRVSQKSIGKNISDKKIYSENDLKLQISYLQRNDFLQERMLGFDISETGEKSVFSNLKNNFFNKSAFLLLDETKDGEILTKIIANDFTENMVSIFLSNLFIENYSFNYSVGSLPRVDVSFSFEEILNVANLIYLPNPHGFYVNKNNLENIILSQKQIESLRDRTSKNLSKNITYQVINFSLDASSINALNLPFTNVSNFLSGLIQTINISVDLSRNKNFYFNKGNKPIDREFIYPVNGALQISGITDNFNKKTLSQFLQNDSKFSLKIAIGDFSSADSDYSEIIIQNIYLENFSYNVNVNESISYSMSASFESDDKSGLIIKAIKLKTNDLVYDVIRASGGEKLLPKGSIDGDESYLRTLI